MSKKYTLLTSTAFKRDYKKMQKRNYDMSLLNDVIETLLEGNRLPEKNKDHAFAHRHSQRFKILTLIPRFFGGFFITAITHITFQKNNPRRIGGCFLSREITYNLRY